MALDLLTQSTRDSCAICAEKNRKKAFAELDEVYAPGTIISTSAERHFLRATPEATELALSNYLRPAPKLTFRFHTGEEHLIGVDPANFTDDQSFGIIAGASAEVPLQGTIQIIAYAYGDGPSYLYSSSENHLQVQCRVLEISPE